METSRKKAAWMRWEGGRWSIERVSRDMLAEFAAVYGFLDWVGCGLWCLVLRPEAGVWRKELGGDRFVALSRDFFSGHVGAFLGGRKALVVKDKPGVRHKEIFVV